MEYQTLMAFLWIPFYALISKIIFFKEKRLNYTEHLIIYLYTIAQVSLISFSYTLILLCFGFNFVYISYLSILLMIVYNAYVLKRIFKLSVGRTVWKTVQFLLFLVGLMIVFGIVMVILGIASKAAG